MQVHVHHHSGLDMDMLQAIHKQSKAIADSIKELSAKMDDLQKKYYTKTLKKTL